MKDDSKSNTEKKKLEQGKENTSKKSKDVLKESVRGEIKNYSLLVLGSIFCALSYSFFLTPSKFSAGGVGGLAITFNYLFGINVGLAMLMMNIPLFIIGMKSMGRMYGVRTLTGIGLISVLTDLFDGKIISAIKLTHEPLHPIISALFGGLLLGLGLGILFRGKGSSGGSDIIAQVMGKYTSFTPGIAIMLIDFNVIVISGILLGTSGKGTGTEMADFVNSAREANQWELIFYGLITLYVSSKVIDVVLEGISTSKSVHIISQKNDEILNYINDMKRGATIIKAAGAYRKEDRDIIFVILSRKELTQLKAYISSIDDKAFMIVADTHQVLGYGFSKFEKPDTGQIIMPKKNKDKKVPESK